MRRREFIGFLAVAPWPLCSLAQKGKIHTVGMLATGNPDPELFLKSIRESLRDAGYVEGRNIRFEVRTAGDPAVLRRMAAELVTLKVDVVVAFLTPAIQAMKQATSDIPIVMAGVGDPVASGLVASLARPGGNVTGVSTAAGETAAKTLEVVREFFPATRRVALLGNEIDPFTKTLVERLQEAARRMDLEFEAIMTRPGAKPPPIFEAGGAKRIDALFVQGSLASQQLADLTIKHRMLAVSSGQAWTRIGGLMSYGSNLPQALREAGGYVDRILKGRKPADFPVALATKYDLLVNLKTAKAIGLAIPSALLARADEVIE